LDLPTTSYRKYTKGILEKFGLAHKFWQKKYKVNYAEVWACPQLQAKKIQSELSRCLITSGRKNTK